MLDYLLNLVGRLGHWGYLVIFLGAMLESAAFLGLLIPGESLVLVAGFFAAQGLLDLADLIVIVSIGAFLGDSIGYEMGRRIGRPALERYGSRFGLSHARIERAQAFFARHGGKAVFLGRFVGFARALVPFLAGSSRMRYWAFFSYNALGAAVWSPAILLLGYFVGASWQRAERWIGRASAILGGFAVFIVLLVWLWRWAVRHEAAIKRYWKRFLKQPRIDTLLHRLAPQIAFVRARLSPEGYLGLRLTLGALVLVGAGWLFGGVTEDVLTGDPLTIVDRHVAEWLHSHATPQLTQWMLVVTHLHGIVAIGIYALLAALFLAWKRDWYWLLCLSVTIPSGMVLNVLTKLAFHRARPSFDDPILTLSTDSFPSGHVAGATLFYGVLAAMLVAKIDQWRWGVLMVFAAISLIALVALTRMYLGVHYLSDVIAGFAEALAWLTLCLLGIHTFWEHRAKRRQSKSA
jgi:membrane protein DedA with SNARE-associated domain/membrane-associated phospholipid phosphatase